MVGSESPISLSKPKDALKKLPFQNSEESFTIHLARGCSLASPMDVHRMEAWQ